MCHRNVYYTKFTPEYEIQDTYHKKRTICSYYWAPTHTHARIHTNTQCEEMHQTVNSLGHYSYKHKSPEAIIPSLKKISMYM
jgi:hypothetical protein